MVEKYWVEDTERAFSNHKRPVMPNEQLLIHHIVNQATIFIFSSAIVDLLPKVMQKYFVFVVNQ
jgi:hypothetical protein